MLLKSNYVELVLYWIVGQVDSWKNVPENVAHGFAHILGETARMVFAVAAVEQDLSVTNFTHAVMSLQRMGSSKETKMVTKFMQQCMPLSLSDPSAALCCSRADFAAAACFLCSVVKPFVMCLPR